MRTLYACNRSWQLLQESHCYNTEIRKPLLQLGSAMLPVMVLSGDRHGLSATLTSRVLLLLPPVPSTALQASAALRAASSQ